MEPDERFRSWAFMGAMIVIAILLLLTHNDIKRTKAAERAHTVKAK